MLNLPSSVPTRQIIVLSEATMLLLKQVNHIAIICSDYQRSRDFYCQLLGFELLNETWREARSSWKADLALNGQYLIELFSFPNSPIRASYPEACGLRHLAFTVDDIQIAMEQLKQKGVKSGPIRQDPLTGKNFIFFSDPDGLPLELCQE